MVGSNSASTVCYVGDILLVDVKINLNRLNLLTTFTHLIMIDALLRAAKYLHVYVCS